jgi:two-component system chemotaxis response regulator CheB
VAKVAGADAVAAILTGMGADGAEGMLAMRAAGSITIGQDEASSVVYGMPAVAHRIGAVVQQMPLRRIAARLLQECRA